MDVLQLQKKTPPACLSIAPPAACPSGLSFSLVLLLDKQKTLHNPARPCLGGHSSGSHGDRAWSCSLQAPKGSPPSPSATFPAQISPTNCLWVKLVPTHSLKLLQGPHHQGKQGLIYHCTLGNCDFASIPHSPHLPLYYSVFSLLPNEPSRDLQV